MTRVSSYDPLDAVSIGSVKSIGPSTYGYMDKFNERYADTCDYDRDLHLSRSVYVRHQTNHHFRCGSQKLIPPVLKPVLAKKATYVKTVAPLTLEVLGRGPSK